jgi:hypothetical protein
VIEAGSGTGTAEGTGTKATWKEVNGNISLNTAKASPLVGGLEDDKASPNVISGASMPGLKIQ